MSVHFFLSKSPDYSDAKTDVIFGVGNKLDTKLRYFYRCLFEHN